MPLSPDTTLGSYTILSLLGKGGMGEVWRARDSTLDRDVAIKVLPETLASALLFSCLHLNSPLKRRLIVVASTRLSQDHAANFP